MNRIAYRIAPVVALAGLLAVSAPTGAFAHALLEHATPPVGGTVRTAPAEVSIAFSEAVEPHFSRIEVKDAQGRRVDKGDDRTAPGDAKRLVVGLKPLTPGTYTVNWQAVSVDTHRTQGSFRFTVAR